MAQVTLPTELQGKMKTWFERILETPASFRDTTRVENEPTIFDDEDDPFDPNVPGVSEEFILNKDKTVSEYKGVSLDTNGMHGLFSLIYPPADLQIDVVEWAEEHFGMNFQSVSGRFFYPGPGGFMGWHTNADTPGKKIYVAYASEEEGSFFRYYDNEKQQVITDWDSKGLNVRVFDISSDPEHYYWHCVYAYKDRISYGFYLV